MAVFSHRAQDICIVLSFTALLFTLYSTYVFQAGLAELLYNKFRAPFIIVVTYFLLCVSHHIWIVVSHSRAPFFAQWPTSLTVLYIIQRICECLLHTGWIVSHANLSIAVSPVYYYMYKRSALKMSDPRFYENFDWVTEFLAIK